MLGVNLQSTKRGGIGSVIEVYRDSGLFDRWPIEYLATVTAGNLLVKTRTASAALWRFVRLLMQRRVALLHAHTASRASFWRKSLFMMLAFAARVPVLLHLHGGRFEDFYERECGPLRRALIRTILQRAERVVVLSSGWKAFIERIAPSAQVTCLYNPVAIAATPTGRRSDRDILFLGRLTQAKGFFDLLEAFAIVKERFPAACLRCGGEGDLDEVRARASMLGIENDVDLLGWINGSVKERWLAEATIYVLPSYAEGLPMGVLEAMGAGLPTVSTPVGGIPDAIDDGAEGFLVEPGDVRALAERIMQLLGDAELREKMGAAAWAKARRCFSIEQIVLQMELLYRGLGARPRAAHGSRQSRYDVDSYSGVEP